MSMVLAVSKVAKYVFLSCQSLAHANCFKMPLTVLTNDFCLTLTCRNKVAVKTPTIGHEKTWTSACHLLVASVGAQ